VVGSSKGKESGTSQDKIRGWSRLTVDDLHFLNPYLKVRKKESSS
jgi:hypothetical protein